MPAETRTRDDPWLKTPLHTQTGSLLLAGNLRNITGIDPGSMRILGEFALIYIVQGRGFYADANRQQLRFKPGDALLVFPDLAHAYGPDPDTDWEQIYVVFRGPQFELLRNSLVLREQHPIWHLEPVEYWKRRIEDTFQGAGQRRGSAADLRTMGQWVHLLSDMAATDAEARRGPDKVWLEESLHLLADRGDSGWLTPRQVAGKVGLSYESFRKRFAEEMGESPGQYQKRRRIEQACAAIYQESRSFKELADELGFCDAFHFSKAFRQVVGEPPSVFRRKVRGR